VLHSGEAGIYGGSASGKLVGQELVPITENVQRKMALALDRRGRVAFGPKANEKSRRFHRNDAERRYSDSSEASLVTRRDHRYRRSNVTS
jgi:hypothetical protein